MHLSSAAREKTLKITCADTNQTFKLQEKNGTSAVIAESKCSIFCKPDSKNRYVWSVYIGNCPQNFARRHVPHDNLTTNMSNQKSSTVSIQAEK